MSKVRGGYRDIYAECYLKPIVTEKLKHFLISISLILTYNSIYNKSLVLNDSIGIGNYTEVC